MTKLFIDANVLIDIVISDRPYSKDSDTLYNYLIECPDKFSLFTSCDLITTLYYVFRRTLSQDVSLKSIKVINDVMKVIEFGNTEINEAIELMERNKKYTDLEDTIQYIMARKEKCDYIITNDKDFASGDVPILSTEEALGVLALK
jgi:predicted nucleic acid-binding protein